MSGSAPYRLRPCRSDDVAPLVDLFCRVFDRQMNQATWRWKHDPQGSAIDNSWLAVDGDDKPIFHYAGIPCGLCFDGREVEAMVSVDAMVAPEYRGRGLLFEVADHAYGVWRQAGMPLTLGMPNEKWGSTAKRLGWQKLFALRWRFRPLHPEAMLAHRMGLPWLRRVRAVGGLVDRLARRSPEADNSVREITAAGREIDLLWQRTRGDRRFSIVRDAARVGWRYLAKPQNRYRLLLAERTHAGGTEPVGYAALRLEETPEGRRLGWIAEVHSGREELAVQHLLIDRAVELLRHAGAEMVGTLAVPGSDYDRALDGAGCWFKRASFSIECVLFDESLSLAELRRPEDWLVAGGDFDVI